MITAGMLRALSDPEQQVLLAHERAHASGLHYLFTTAARLAAAANPLLRPVASAVGYSVERWADERAAAVTGDREVAARAISCGAAVRVPGLLASPPAGALYRVAGRHGVAVAALPTTSLTRAEVASLLRFRLAQYLDIGFVDRHVACARQMRTEPESVVARGDVHVVAGAPDTGEILCWVRSDDCHQPPPARAPGHAARS